MEQQTAKPGKVNYSSYDHTRKMTYQYNNNICLLRFIYTYVIYFNLNPNEGRFKGIFVF